MYAVFLGLVALFTPGDVTVMADTTGDYEGTPKVVVIGDCGHVEAIASPKIVVETAKKGEEALPKFWIGVRITEVPAPLAAHIGKHGALVANVVKGSPADTAGLEQYDVITAAGNTEIKCARDLFGVTAKAETAETVTLTVVRHAEEQEIEVTLAVRPAVEDQELKYAEPEDEVVGDAMRWRGRMLKRGPDGQWLFEDLGPLSCMPDALKKLQEFNLQWHEGLDDEDTDEAGAKHKKIEIRVQAEDDGSSTTLQVDSDGKISVTRTDAVGETTTATYENADELAKADPEAFKLYEEHGCAGGHGDVFFKVRPLGDRANKLRWEYQIDVQKKLQEALKDAAGAREKAMEEYQKAMQKAHEAMEGAKVKIRQHVRPGGDEEATATTVIVRVDDAGKIKVVVTKGGEEKTYEFNSKAEFQGAEPHLYEEVADCLD